MRKPGPSKKYAHQGVLVMIPARNEERTLPWVLAGVRRHLPGAGILVVSDGSSDRTSHVAREAGAAVIVLGEPRGYGEAVRAGFEEAKRRRAAYLLQLDADGQHDPQSLPGLLKILRAKGRPDIVIGSRFLNAESYKPPFPRLLGMWFFSVLASRLTGRTITDPTSGLRGFSARALRHFATDSYRSRYHDADVLVRAHRAGLAIVEGPVRMRAAPSGRSMHRGAGVLVYPWRMLWATLFA